MTLPAWNTFLASWHANMPVPLTNQVSIYIYIYIHCEEFCTHSLREQTPSCPECRVRYAESPAAPSWPPAGRTPPRPWSSPPVCGRQRPLSSRQTRSMLLQAFSNIYTRQRSGVGVNIKYPCGILAAGQRPRRRLGSASLGCLSRRRRRRSRSRFCRGIYSVNSKEMNERHKGGVYGRAYLSLRTSLDAPAAFLTSMGLMLAAWTLMRMSFGLDRLGLGSWSRRYPEGGEYAGMVIESMANGDAMKGSWVGHFGWYYVHTCLYLR